jgi:hypothetical protein
MFREREERGRRQIVRAGSSSFLRYNYRLQCRKDIYFFVG